jgi:hypothetical protein
VGPVTSPPLLVTGLCLVALYLCTAINIQVAHLIRYLTDSERGSLSNVENLSLQYYTYKLNAYVLIQLL